jgi:pimeloyl-ACP methyl ester carboxylesterase
MLDGGYYLRKPPTDTEVELEREIKDQIQSDNDYCFAEMSDYLEAEKGDVNHWNDLLADAAKDRMIFKDGKLCWHLSNDLTARAFRGIFNASPDKIYKSVKSNQLNKNTKLLRATVPTSRTDRLEFAGIFHAETGIDVEAIPDAGHSIHLDRPAAVIEQVIKLFT